MPNSHADRSSSTERYARGLARRLTFRLALLRCMLLGGLGMMSVALVVLGLRVGLGQTAPSVWLLPLAGLGSGMIAGMIWSWRSRVRAAGLLPLLDERSRGGGLVMASGFPGASAWSGVRQGDVSVPAMRWAWRTPAAAIAIAGAVTLTALLSPAGTAAGGDRGLDLSGEIERISANLETLERAEAIDPGRSEAYREELEAIAEHADADRPGVSWEAMDEVARQLESIAEQAARELSEAIESSEALADAAEAGAGASGSMSSASAGALAEALADFANDHESLAGQQAMQEAMEALRDAAEMGAMDADQRAQAAADLAEALAELARAAAARAELSKEHLDRLCEGGLCKNPGAGRSKEERELAREALRKMLEESLDEDELAELTECLKRCLRRGTTDGGPAEMAFDDPTGKEGAEFTPESITAQDAQASESILLGSSTGDAGVQASGEASAGGGLASDQSSESGATRSRVLPRHEEAVRRYFQRSSSDSSGGAAEAATGNEEEEPADGQ